MAEEGGKTEISENLDPEALAKGIEVAGEMEKVGFSLLKPIAQRFPVGGSVDSSKVVENRLGQVASASSVDALKSSEWRRDLKSSTQGTEPGQVTPSPVKPTK